MDELEIHELLDDVVFGFVIRNLCLTDQEPGLPLLLQAEGRQVTEHALYRVRILPSVLAQILKLRAVGKTASAFVHTTRRHPRLLERSGRNDPIHERVEVVSGDSPGREREGQKPVLAYE